MMSEVVRTLIVDDEEGIRSTLKEALQRGGYVVATASNGEEALDLLRETSFDAAVLDLNLGGRVDGLRLLEAIRWRWPRTAVVILTAHGSLESAIAAIHQDVDDYLLKPVKPSEVRQVLQRALDRRSQADQKPREQHVVQRGSFFVNLDQHLATKDGRALELTSQELRLLVHLMQNSHRVVPPPELVRVVQEYDAEDLYEARQIIKWYIHRLRQQVEPDPHNPRHIVNVRGVGYMFKE
ncbi:MAG: response regulator transcription factor [Anaerolineae bacterium]|nr:response regulator transcription factor [Anaerolineae bacterium]